MVALLLQLLLYSKATEPLPAKAYRNSYQVSYSIKVVHIPGRSLHDLASRDSRRYGNNWSTPRQPRVHKLCL
jgi:hypothetical protein